MISLCRSKIATTSLLLAFLFGLTACASDDEEVAPVAATPLIPAVVVATLERKTWQAAISAFGVVEALEEVNVAAELSGTVKSVYVDEGDRIEQGQLLLELDDTKRSLAQQQAAQSASRAHAELKEARLRLKRHQDLVERESISREVLDNSQLGVDAASAAYAQAAAAEQLAARELADTRIYSPTAGLVDVQAVEAGEPVQVGATLIRLQAVADLRVHTWISEVDIAHIRAGGAARVSIAGLAGREFASRVEWVGVNADPSTGNFPVKLILLGDTALLRPGMTAKVELDGIAVPDALLLPESALVDRNRRRVVFVVEEGVANIREPLLAAGFSSRLQVLEGLSPGDTVVVGGQKTLRDGAVVRIRTER